MTGASRGRVVLSLRTSRPGAKISVCHGVGGTFAASGTIIMSNEPP
jgi:hypothetical protein